MGRSPAQTAAYIEEQRAFGVEFRPTYETDTSENFRKWKKARAFSIFAVEVPKEQAEAFIAYCDSQKWKVSRA